MAKTVEEKLAYMSNLMDMQEALRLRKDEALEQAKVEFAEVLRQIASVEAEVEEEFSYQFDSLREKIAALEAEIRRDVLALGETVKANGLQAVYMKGRVSWDAKSLDGYALGHPELFAFRKEGEPSVSLRSVGR